MMINGANKIGALIIRADNELKALTFARKNPVATSTDVIHTIDRAAGNEWSLRFLTCKAFSAEAGVLR